MFKKWKLFVASFAAALEAITVENFPPSFFPVEVGEIAAITDEKLLVLFDRSCSDEHEFVVDCDSRYIWRARMIEKRCKWENSGADDFVVVTRQAETVRDRNFHLLSHKFVQKLLVFWIIRDRFHELHVLIHQFLKLLGNGIPLQRVHDMQQIFLLQIFIAFREIEVKNSFHFLAFLDKLLKLFNLPKNPQSIKNDAVCELKNVILIIGIDVDCLALEVVKAIGGGHAGFGTEHD